MRKTLSIHRLVGGDHVAMITGNDNEGAHIPGNLRTLQTYNLHSFLTDPDSRLRMFLEKLLEVSRDGLDYEDEDRAVQALREFFASQRAHKEAGDDYISFEEGLLNLLTQTFVAGQALGEHLPAQEREEALWLLRLEPAV